MINLKLAGEFCDAFGPSGYEHDVADVAVKNITDYPVKKDYMQNVYINLDENTTKPVVMLDAHTDEVGFMVQSIQANGLLKIIPLGGWVETNVPAHLFMIKNSKGELHRAISTSKPPHFTSAEEAKRPLNILNDILLDLGVTSREQVFDVFGVQVGDPVMPDVKFDYNEKTGMMFGKAFDCRLGCAAVVEVMNKLKGEDLPVHVVGALSTQEEVGLRGAKVASKVIKPDFAIIMEGSPADDLYVDKFNSQCAVQSGPQLRYRDGGMVANPQFINLAKEISEKYGIKAQFAVRTSGSTNAAAIHLENQGTPCLVLALPSRYIHTHYCYAHIDDLQSMIDMTVEVIKSMTPEKIKEIFEV